MRIGVFALQGAFIEHVRMLQRLGVEAFEIHSPADWEKAKDGIILPGGESTTQIKLLRDLNMFDSVKAAIDGGLPVFGTCAGMILLSKSTVNDNRAHLATMDISVRRNAYGRQLGSFHTLGTIKGVGDDVPMTFIRAPYIEEVLSPDCQVLSECEGRIVAARQGRQLVTAFHPELDDDVRVHKCFLDMCK